MTNFWKSAQRAFLGAALLLMLAHSAIYAYYSLSLMRFPFDYDQGEGFELVDVMYLSEGKLPYRNAEEFPFYSSNYPPVYHVVLVPFAWLFGAEYWYGRLLSFWGTLVTAAAIGYAVYRAEGRRALAWLLGLAFLSSNYIYHIGPLFRQHYFMVMFEVLAVVVVANAFTLPQPQQRRRIIWALVLLLLAGYTKQLAASTIIAVFIWLFIRAPRRAVLHALWFGAVAGGVFLVLELAADGWWWKNVVAANVNQYNLGQFTGLLRQFTRLHWVLLLFTGWMLIYELYFSRISVYAVWALVSLVSTVGAGKWGAGDSYFATSIAAICILSGIFIARCLNQSWSQPENYLSRPLRPLLAQLNRAWVGVLCLALMVVYGLTVVKMPTSGTIFEPLSQALGFHPNHGHRYPLYDAAGWTIGYATIGHLTSQADVDAGWQIVERIRAVEQPVMSEEAGFSLRAGREVVSNPTQLKNLYDSQVLDPAKLIQMIEDQELGMIIFRARFYPELVLAAVDDAYHPLEVIDMNGFQYQLWYPEPTWETRRHIRNFLEAQPAGGASLQTALPATVEDIETWLVEMMSRWAWLPELETPEAPSDGCALVRAFQRRGQRVLIELCGDELVVGVS